MQAEGVALATALAIDDDDMTKTLEEYLEV